MKCRLFFVLKFVWEYAWYDNVQKIEKFALQQCPSLTKFAESIGMSKENFHDARDRVVKSNKNKDAKKQLASEIIKTINDDMELVKKLLKILIKRLIN